MVRGSRNTRGQTQKDPDRTVILTGNLLGVRAPNSGKPVNTITNVTWGEKLFSLSSIQILRTFSLKIQQTEIYVQACWERQMYSNDTDAPLLPPSTYFSPELFLSHPPSPLIIFHIHLINLWFLRAVCLLTLLSLSHCSPSLHLT